MITATASWYTVAEAMSPESKKMKVKMKGQIIELIDVLVVVYFMFMY